MWTLKEAQRGGHMKSSVVHSPQGRFQTIDKISMISLQAETDDWSILLDKEPFY